MINPYITSDVTIAPMFGRKKLFEKVCRMLSKPTPDHISIVGPKHYGKTVFLTHLATHVSEEKKGFLKPVYIDLRHGTPESDTEFKIKLAFEISNNLKGTRNDIADVLRDISRETVYDMLELVFDTLEKESLKILVILDGFDYLSIGTSITPNLLDQIRFLAQKTSLRLITGSRLRLRELCKTEASRTSDFWRIFNDPPLIAGCFDEGELEDIWKPFEDHSVNVEKGAMTELINWTGGIPLLVSYVMRELFNEKLPKTIVSNGDVVNICKRIASDPPDALRDLWDDLDIEMQRLLGQVVSTAVRESDIANKELKELRDKGIADTENGNLKFMSRLMLEYAKSQSTGIQELSRLFRNSEDFQKNIKRVLELRIENLPRLDEELVKSIRYAIRDFPDDPRQVIDSARGIVDSVLDFLLKTEELNAGSKVTADWRMIWDESQKGEKKPMSFPEDIDPIPHDRGNQCKFFRIITGGFAEKFRVAKKISRQTVVLLNQLNSYGNFINHRGGETARLCTANATCFTAIELLASIVEDLQSPKERN